jgi:hypothetical protein
VSGAEPLQVHVADTNPGRFDDNPREVVMKIASMTQSRMHELMDEVRYRLETLVGDPIAEVEREFLEASRILKDL